MKPPKPIKRSTKPIKRSPLKRGTKPIARESAKRKKERGPRARVKATAMRRAGGRCELAAAVPEIACWGPLDADEIEGRGRRPRGHLDDRNVQIACRAHHTWKTDNPLEAARRGVAPFPRGYIGPEVAG